MKYVVFLFYRYYNKGATIRIPYESAILAILSLGFMNIMSLLMLFAPELSDTLFKNHTRTELYIYSGIGVIIGYFITSKLIPKKDILDFKNVPNNIRLHSWLLFFYIIISFLILIFLIIRNRH